MAALSDYLESGILNHIFRGTTFAKPSTIAIALTSGVPKDNDTGSTLPELPSGSPTGQTGYARLNLGDPSTSGNNIWSNVGVDESTAYAVYSEEVSHSGYFYPLYLSQASANAANVAGGYSSNSETYTFANTFPNVNFYAPLNLDVSGATTNPGYTLYEGNGFIKNSVQHIFNTALTDWGWVSGVAVVDSSIYGSGNILMYAQLENPRFVYTGDNIKFDSNSLEISLK